MLAMTAGIDVELPATAAYGEPLKQALASGELSMEIVDEAVSRHLRKKFELGLFENPYVNEGRVLAVFDTPAGSIPGIRDRLQEHGPFQK